MTTSHCKGGGSVAAILIAIVMMVMMPVVAQAQVRVVTYNIAQLRGNQASLAGVLTELSNDDHNGQAHPASILVFQEVTQETFNALSLMLTPVYTAATYTNSNEDSYGGSQAVFYRSDAVFEVPSGHDGTYTGAGRRARRWQFRLTGFNDPFVDFYVYSGHLKAGTGQTNQEERVFGIENILDNMGEIPGAPHIILCGDFNFYSNAEPAYSTLLSYGSNQIVDPLGTDNWTGSSNASMHTQSPRAISDDGLAGGGLDDRFDFQVMTSNFFGSRGLKMIPGSLRAVGNDGNHYNEAINDGDNNYYPGNPARSNALANDLHNASDHLPVMVDYRIPASMTAAMFNSDFGTVITGGTLQLFVNVKNDSMPSYVGGGSDLQWYLDGTGEVGDAVGSGMLAPGSDEWVPFTITPSGSGSVSGSLLVKSDDAFVQGSPVVIPITGTVLQHADASFDSDFDSNFTVVSRSFQAESGVQTIEIPVWNHQWSSGQAALDLDAVENVDEPFQVGGILETGITTEAGSIEIELDTSGLAPGQYSDAMQLIASDEDISGAISQTLTFSIAVTIEESPSECAGDVDDSGQTNVEDLLQVLEGFGSSYDIDDLLTVIADWDCGL